MKFSTFAILPLAIVFAVPAHAQTDPYELYDFDNLIYIPSFSDEYEPADYTEVSVSGGAQGTPGGAQANLHISIKGIKDADETFGGGWNIEDAEVTGSGRGIWQATGTPVDYQLVSGIQYTVNGFVSDTTGNGSAGAYAYANGKVWDDNGNLFEHDGQDSLQTPNSSTLLVTGNYGETSPLETGDSFITITGFSYLYGGPIYAYAGTNTGSTEVSYHGFNVVQGNIYVPTP